MGSTGMKTNPTAKRRGHSGKGTRQKDPTQAEAHVAHRRAKDLARDPDWEPEPREEEAQCKKPPHRPLPEQVTDCWKRLASFGLAKRIELTRKGLDTLRDQAALGRSQRTTAYVLGISHSMLDTLLKDNEEARAAYELGKGLFEDRYTDALTRMAEQGNVAAAIWVEKTRMGRRDNTPVSDGARHVHIHLPDSVSREEYMNSLALAHKASHSEALQQAKDAEAIDVTPAPPAWLTDGSQKGPEPTQAELQSAIAEAMAPRTMTSAIPSVPEAPTSEQPATQGQQTAQSRDVSR